MVLPCQLLQMCLSVVCQCCPRRSRCLRDALTASYFFFSELRFSLFWAVATTSTANFGSRSASFPQVLGQVPFPTSRALCSRPRMSQSAAKRIMAEWRELSALNSQPGSLFYAAPLETDLFEWHFTVRGPPDTPFEQGLYHGRIVLPTEYPMKAPEIILLTPNGRFEVGTRICLSVTAHHNEMWQPSWGIRTILTALVGFMPSKSEGFGALDFPAEERRRLARKSWAFTCPRCGARPAEQFRADATDAAGTSSSAAQPVSLSCPTENETQASVCSDALHCGNTAGVECQTDSDALEPDASRPQNSDPRSTANGSLGHRSGDIALSSVRSTEIISRSTARESVPSSGRNRSSTSSSSRAAPEETKEKALLCLAYAIAFAIVIVISNRLTSVFQTFPGE